VWLVNEGEARRAAMSNLFLLVGLGLACLTSAGCGGHTSKAGPNPAEVQKAKDHRLAALVKTPHVFQVTCGPMKHPARVLSVPLKRWTPTGDATVYSCIFRYTDNGNVGSLCYRIPHNQLAAFNEEKDLIVCPGG
jgi:hypothetical protein